jgi:hypothetical protein
MNFNVKMEDAFLRDGFVIILTIVPEAKTKLLHAHQGRHLHYHHVTRVNTNVKMVNVFQAIGNATIIQIVPEVKMRQGATPQDHAYRTISSATLEIVSQRNKNVTVGEIA